VVVVAVVVVVAAGADVVEAVSSSPHPAANNISASAIGPKRLMSIPLLVAASTLSDFAHPRPANRSAARVGGGPAGGIWVR
jgi:hypothetical protein